jgi:pimeloyl-ACP methyl ester carboxylesterase
MSEGDVVGPSSHFFVSQRLRLHYVDWGNETKPLLVLVHGGRDHARSWDWVARELRRDHHVVALDLRGHGDSGWAVGGGYAITDFVLDLARLLEALDRFPVSLVAHSLGGMIALQYAGIYPERVGRLVAVEGLGPPPEMLRRMLDTPAWERMRGWIERMQELAGRKPRPYPSIEAAAQRMLEENSFLSPEQARHLTIHGVARNEDGTYGWKFDNYVRALWPHRPSQEELHALWARIECPVLLVRGAESWSHDPVEDGRVRPFRDARLVTIAGAGHWVHHDRLEEFLRAVQPFLAERVAAPAEAARSAGR